jgi:hypothetical protein
MAGGGLRLWNALGDSPACLEVAASAAAPTAAVFAQRGILLSRPLLAGASAAAGKTAFLMGLLLRLAIGYFIR